MEPDVSLCGISRLCYITIEQFEGPTWETRDLRKFRECRTNICLLARKNLHVKRCVRNTDEVFESSRSICYYAVFLLVETKYPNVELIKILAEYYNANLDIFE